ncbi:MAG TPA: aconitase/3-isopropylmalate dehydratase large subunit family protein [Trebonia sp.]|jgi:3-isopropylmalate/(R)-2-methylmalate dehydratase large subunit
MGQTIAEKVMSRQNLGGEDVAAGDLIDARVDGLLAITYQHIRSAYQRAGYPDGPPTVFDRDRVFLMNEHNQPPKTVALAQTNLQSRQDAERLGLANYRSEMGVCHQMMVDYGYVRPGEFVVGNDSHTISYGGINAVATGIGSDEAAYVWAFGELYFTVPETIKINLTGRPRPYPFGKDVILHLAGLYGDAFGQGYSLEFDGQLARDMDVAARLTIADHAVEVGAKFGIFGADDKTAAYVRARTDKPFTPVAADPDASYAKVIDLDCDSFGFQVAKPFRFDNVAPVREVAGTKIDQARLGSCANGHYEDIEIAARMLRGRKVAPGVRFYVSPASLPVYQQCVRDGLIADLLEAGAQVENPGCSICQTPGIVLNEEVCISSTTRNYRGRMGGVECSEAQIYLASPATVAAAAIAGEITDPLEFLDV